jgi:hypothetical protein
MENKSSVFETNYEFYLGQIKKISLEDIAVHLGVEFTGNKMMVPLFGNIYKIGWDGIFDRSEKRPLYAICIVLFKYLLTSPQTIFIESPWTSYKDFLDAGPLIGFFFQ